MNWNSEGYVLSVRKHGETSAIIDVLTPDYGRHLGLVRGGISRKIRPVLQPGNKINVEWNARLSEHLGSFKVEPLVSNSAQIMEDRLSLSALNSLCAIARECLPEREVHLDVYQAFGVVLNNIGIHEIWPALYIKWESGLLSAMGYGLDLKSCAATGSKDNLTHVSPRSGRAVSAEAAEPYEDKLFLLPKFLISNSSFNPADLRSGLELTGFFLETRLQWGVNKTLPDERRRMIQLLNDNGYVA
ncbi:DNA repair protein RecO [Hellea sp.]|nr:DNA repair protein RecO [Hellea sp.]MDA8997043.1 DNA repair protein RecO [Hellea sp.]